MGADKGKKQKVAEKDEDENNHVDHFEGELYLCIKKLQEMQDELEKGHYKVLFVSVFFSKDPDIRPLVEQDTQNLQRLLPEIPLWVKNPDYDRVDWLNKFLECMWPYLDKAICKTAKNIATPIIAVQIPKYKIESVEFETLTLGSLPPTLQGMKVYVTNEKEFPKMGS